MPPLECGIIIDGIPEGAISRKVGLIWGIPAETISLEVELPWGDFNNDGVVDILDLSVTGGNLGKTEGRWRQP